MKLLILLIRKQAVGFYFKQVGNLNIVRFSQLGQ